MKGNPVVAAVILGVFIVAAVLIYRYTSPFNQCFREKGVYYACKDLD